VIKSYELNVRFDFSNDVNTAEVVQEINDSDAEVLFSIETEDKDDCVTQVSNFLKEYFARTSGND
jgi:hypothetical protein